MLKISRQQMDVFRDYTLGRFVERMVKHLKDDFPDECQKQGLKEDDLEPMVRRGITDAQRYGVEYTSDLELYIDCMVLLNPGFDQDEQFPWAREILMRKDIDGEEKMAEIDGYLMFGMEEPL